MAAPQRRAGASASGRDGGHEADGVPFLLPHGALLYKAAHASDKDRADFAQVVPRMDAAARGWLATAIEDQHPGHRWARLLGA